MNKTKNALVISGGGSKGAFAVGAVTHLIKDLKLNFDIISGTSVGALIAPLIVTNEISDLNETFSSLKTKDLFRKRWLPFAFLFRDSVFDVKPGWKRIQKELDEDRCRIILNSNKQMFLTTVNLQTGRVVYFQSGPATKTNGDVAVTPLQNREQLLKAVLASANQPVLMKPVEVMNNGGPLRQYVDGGVREIAPLKIAIDNGATDIYAIILSPEKHEPVEKRYNRIPKILLRTISLFTEEIVLNDAQIAQLYNEGIVYVDCLKKRLREKFGLEGKEIDELFAADEIPNPFKGKRVVNLHIIRPGEELPTDGLDFQPEIMQRMIKIGKSRADEMVTAKERSRLVH